MLSGHAIAPIAGEDNQSRGFAVAFSGFQPRKNHQFKMTLRRQRRRIAPSNTSPLKSGFVRRLQSLHNSLSRPGSHRDGGAVAKTPPAARQLCLDQARSLKCLRLELPDWQGTALNLQVRWETGVMSRTPCQWPPAAGRALFRGGRRRRPQNPRGPYERRRLRRVEDRRL